MDSKPKTYEQLMHEFRSHIDDVERNKHLDRNKRLDHYASLAMQGMLASGSYRWQCGADLQIIADRAFVIAKHMINACDRAKEDECTSSVAVNRALEE